MRLGATPFRNSKNLTPAAAPLPRRGEPSEKEKPMRSIQRINKMLDDYVLDARLESPSPTDVTIFHIFCDLIDYAERHGVDLANAMTEARRHMAEHNHELRA
jgi:hypothetical protein